MIKYIYRCTQFLFSLRKNGGNQTWKTGEHAHIAEEMIMLTTKGIAKDADSSDTAEALMTASVATAETAGSSTPTTFALLAHPAREAASSGDIIKSKTSYRKPPANKMGKSF